MLRYRWFQNTGPYSIAVELRKAVLLTPQLLKK